MPRRFLTTEWRDLLMLNYVVEPAVIQPRIPQGCEIDTFRGQAFVSLIGFVFRNTRLLGVPIPWHRHFPEVNLRTYVVRRVGEEIRRGVIFLKDVVPLPAVAFVARQVYGEPFYWHRMWSSFTDPRHGRRGSAEYGFAAKGEDFELRATFHGEPKTPPADSEEAFIAEHYWGYTRLSNTQTAEYRVEHPPWKIWPADFAEFTGDTDAFYGREFQPALSAPAHSAFIADGSAVVVNWGRRI